MGKTRTRGAGVEGGVASCGSWAVSLALPSFVAALHAHALHQRRPRAHPRGCARCAACSPRTRHSSSDLCARGRRARTDAPAAIRECRDRSVLFSGSTNLGAIRGPTVEQRNTGMLMRHQIHTWMPLSIGQAHAEPTARYQDMCREPTRDRGGKWQLPMMKNGRMIPGREACSSWMSHRSCRPLMQSDLLLLRWCFSTWHHSTSECWQHRHGA